MRQHAMPDELVDLERRLAARHAGVEGGALRAEVKRAVETELDRPACPARGGWNWTAVGVALLLVLNLSAVWGVGKRNSASDQKNAGWVLAHGEWQMNEKLNPELWHGFSTRIERR